MNRSGPIAAATVLDAFHTRRGLDASRPLLLSVGALAYDGRQDCAGSMLSVGFSKAQLDIGYKPHWFSRSS
jgi:hypothetical protein